MIRPTEPEDMPALLQMAEGTGVFKPYEVEGLSEVLEDYHEREQYLGHVAYTWVENGTPIGFVYYAPADLTDGTWDLWWIIVTQPRQGQGLGARLLEYVEQAVRHEGGRQLLIETSGLPQYDPTQRFYLKHGYKLTARIPDYYADGDDLVIFSKRITPPIV